MSSRFFTELVPQLIDLILHVNRPAPPADELLPQLTDFIPHVDRLAPPADELLSADSGPSNTSATEHHLAAGIEAIRSDLAVAAAAHASLGSDLREHARLAQQTQQDLAAALSAHVRDLSSEFKTTAESAADARSVAFALGHSVVSLDREVRTLRSLLVSTLVLLVILALMVGWLVLTHSH